jgi:chemosensory pili system protein ChpA (sensor histidine kinase/response regulator)
MTRTVIAVVDDLFFASKIRGTAEQHGVGIRFAKTPEAVIKEAAAQLPALVIVDLHSQRCDPIELARQLKSDAQLREIPLLGFFSHVQTELQQRAEQAGFDQVVPRSAFAKNLREILLGKD